MLIVNTGVNLNLNLELYHPHSLPQSMPHELSHKASHFDPGCSRFKLKLIHLNASNTVVLIINILHFVLDDEPTKVNQSFKERETKAMYKLWGTRWVDICFLFIQGVPKVKPQLNGKYSNI